MANFNPQAIVIKSMIDKARDQQEVMKFAFTSTDNSEGSNLLMANTAKKGFYRARYLSPEAQSLRNSIFNNG